MNDYLNVIRNNYANFQGRARRREFWMFTLINTVVLVLLQIPVQGAVLAMSARQDSGDSGLGGLSGVTVVFALLLLIYSLATLLPSLAVSVRRLHDTGKSGWWYAITLVPFVGSLALLVLMVLDSEPGSNRWGPNPKGGGQAGTVSANTW